MTSARPSGIRARRPDALGVVVKHDDSGAGDGNVVVDLCDATGREFTDAEIRSQLEATPAWYQADLAHGAVVEELSPARPRPVRVSSSTLAVRRRSGGVDTEQVLGGATRQIYSGCRFPANPAYSPDLAAHGLAIGRSLADHGVVGRLGADFMAAADEAGRWSLYALEINLRKGGTTHPYSALRHLVPGQTSLNTGAGAPSTERPGATPRPTT